MVLSFDLRTSEMKVMVHHIQRGMPEYFLKREDVTDVLMSLIRGKYLLFY